MTHLFLLYGTRRGAIPVRVSCSLIHRSIFGAFSMPFQSPSSSPRYLRLSRARRCFFRGVGPPSEGKTNGRAFRPVAGYARCTTKPPGASVGSPALASSGVIQKLMLTAAGSAWTWMPSFDGSLSYLRAPASTASTEEPRSPPRLVSAEYSNVAAAAPPRLVSADYERRGRGVAATRRDRRRPARAARL